MTHAPARRMPTWVTPLAGALALHALGALVITALRAPPRATPVPPRTVDVAILHGRLPSPAAALPVDAPTSPPPAVTRPAPVPARRAPRRDAPAPVLPSPVTVPAADAPVPSPSPASPTTPEVDVAPSPPQPAAAPVGDGATPASAGTGASPGAETGRGGATLAATAPRATTLTTSVPVVRAAPARLLRRTEPAYPVMARRAGVQGRVTVSLDVDEHGRVLHATPISGPPLLAAAAVEAARTWMFAPARGADGRAVRTRVEGAVDFRLR